MAQAGPIDQAVEALVKAWPALFLAAAGGVLAWLRKARVRRAKEREEQRLQGKAIRYLLDAKRIDLAAIIRHVSLDAGMLEMLVRHKALIDGVRDELWVHDGHESVRIAEQAAENVVKVLTRTQAIDLKKKRVRDNRVQDMFSEADIQESERNDGRAH